MLAMKKCWAARVAHVTHFTDTLPHGIDTQVGPRGTQLRLVQSFPSKFETRIITDLI